MFEEQLQRTLDTLRDTSPQRVALGALAVLSVYLALAVSFTGTDETSGAFGWVVVAIGVLAVVQAGSHTALLVIILVSIEWVAANDDITSPRTVVVASLLFVFHTTLALMAVTPHSAAVDAEVLRRWVRRTGALIAATISIWGLVWSFSQRRSPADPMLTLLALVVIVVGALALRRRSVGDSGA